MSRPFTSVESPMVNSPRSPPLFGVKRSEEHTSELQSQSNLVCRLLLEKKKKNARFTSRHRSSPSFSVLQGSSLTFNSDHPHSPWRPLSTSLVFAVISCRCYRPHTEYIA